MIDVKDRAVEAVGPRALLRLVEVLAFLSDRKEGATLTEIGSALDVPVSSLLAILRVLVGEHYLERRATSYVIGRGSYDLAKRILGQNQLGVLARGLMFKLSREINETVVLARADDQRKCVVYTDVVEGEAAVRYAVPLGATRPYYACAAGRIFLAYKDQAWLRRYLETTPLVRLTPRTMHQQIRLVAALKDIRRKGVSQSIEEATDGGAGIAAPIFGDGQALVGVLTIGAIATRARREGPKYRAAVKRSAAEISALLAALGPA
jgi:IclR family acetate operon transcriptional repressor